MNRENILSALKLFTATIAVISLNSARASERCEDALKLGRDLSLGRIIPDVSGNRRIVVRGREEGDSPVSMYERTGDRYFRASIESLEQIGNPQLVKNFFENIHNEKLLDVGCGDGGLVKNLRQSGVEATGIDIALRPTQKKLAYFLQRDMRKTGLPDAYFDKIVAVAGPFYYPERPEFRSEGLHELLRVLKPGGKILFIGFTGYVKNYDQLARQGDGNSSVNATIEYYLSLIGGPHEFNQEIQRQLSLFPNVKLVGADYDGKGTVLLQKDP